MLDNIHCTYAIYLIFEGARFDIRNLRPSIIVSNQFSQEISRVRKTNIIMINSIDKYVYMFLIKFELNSLYITFVQTAWAHGILLTTAYKFYYIYVI